MSKENYINIESVYFPQREQNSNKSTFGKVLNIAGSKNYTGAAYLSSIAALCVGAGYSTLASSGYVVDKIAAMCCDITYFELTDLSKDIELLNDYDVYSIGCGLSKNPFSIDLVLNFLDIFKNSNKKFIFDADALNIISDFNGVILPQHSVLTPHPKELSRLMGVDLTKILDNRESYLKSAIDKFNCTVVLKGHNSLIGTKNKEITINTSGNSTLAKAGSGDVLTGIIAGLAAQGCGVEDAAKLGVYLHGIAGELYSNEFSQYSMLASDLVKYIPKAIKKILGSF